MGPAISKSTLLKYRFDTVAELHAHCHVVDGRTLFFYRHPHAHLPGEAKVLLGVSFQQSEQEVIVRGAVLGRVEGAIPGLWLELPDARLARRMDAGGLAARRQKRLGCDVMVEVRYARQPHLGRLVDLSLNGARMAGINGLGAHAQVELRLLSKEGELPSELGQAEIVRTQTNEVGARFLRKESGSRLAITRLFGALQQSWQGALEAQHPAICCKGGQFLEPALPHVRGGAGGRGVL